MQHNVMAHEVIDKPIEFPSYNPETHEKSAIKVTVPNTAERIQFITTVAYYVSKDRSIIEQ